MENNPFENRIREYLEDFASKDEMFAEKMKNEKKNIGECCDFIINQVKKSNRSAFTNDEIFGMAIHYYDEENVGDIEKMECTVKMSKIELTEEEKSEIRKQAVEEEREKLRSKMNFTVKYPAKKKQENESQLQLF